jgi:hypothetical protein
VSSIVVKNWEFNIHKNHHNTNKPPTMSILIGTIIGLSIPYFQYKYWQYKYKNLNIPQYIQASTTIKNNVKYIDVSTMHPYIAMKIVEHIHNNT